ncbi:MAG: sigma-70 family RNA polymerase sigma factor [Lachnospiraceae bacterium]|nr:sigma-70 family RNA polymerase sigma factor [Lachnospiraceae bacterium]
MEQKQIAQLVERIQSGDRQAFEEIYRETSKNVYFICISFLNNEEEAKDVMQDTYITAYQKLEQLQEKEKFTAWISQIAVNKCKKILLKNSPMLMEPESMINLATENNENFLPEEYITQKSKRKIVMDIMRKKLSDIQYQTVILFYFNDLSIEEIADIMECPPGTVKYRLSVSRAKIKEGVLEYENESKDKLYSFAPIPFLAGLLAMEAENIAVPDVWAGIMQSLEILHGGMVAGATHTVEQMVTDGVARATEAEAKVVAAHSTRDTVVSEVAKKAATGTMKGKGVMGKVGKILSSLLKHKIVIGIVGLVAVAGLTIAVVSIINNKSGEEQAGTLQNGSLEDVAQENAAGLADDSGTLPDAETVISEYDGDGDPYFYRENSWLGTHDYSTGQLESQPEIVIFQDSENPITLPLKPEDILPADIIRINDTWGNPLYPYFEGENGKDLMVGRVYFQVPEFTICVNNYTSEEIFIEECIEKGYYYIPIYTNEEDLYDFFGCDITTVEEEEGKTDAYIEYFLGYLVEQYGSPNYISYDYADYTGESNNNAIWKFNASINFAWVFEDYVIYYEVSERFEDMGDGKYEVDLWGDSDLGIYTKEAWEALEPEYCPYGNMIDEIYSEDFLMPLGCEFPRIELDPI